MAIRTVLHKRYIISTVQSLNDFQKSHDNRNQQTIDNRYSLLTTSAHTYSVALQAVPRPSIRHLSAAYGSRRLTSFTASFYSQLGGAVDNSHVPDDLFRALRARRNPRAEDIRDDDRALSAAARQPATAVCG